MLILHYAAGDYAYFGPLLKYHEHEKRHADMITDAGCFRRCCHERVRLKVVELRFI